MPGSWIVGLVIGIAFLGKSIYELASGKAITRSGTLRRSNSPWAYWLIVVFSALVGAFILGVTIVRRVSV